MRYHYSDGYTDKTSGLSQPPHGVVRAQVVVDVIRSQFNRLTGWLILDLPCSRSGIIFIGQTFLVFDGGFLGFSTNVVEADSSQGTSDHYDGCI